MQASPAVLMDHLSMIVSELILNERFSQCQVRRPCGLCFASLWNSSIQSLAVNVFLSQTGKIIELLFVIFRRLTRFLFIPYVYI